MNTQFNGVTHTILHTLLDRYEQPGRQNVVRVRLKEQAYPHYFSPIDATPRQATNSALQQLADQGLLHLHWQKWEQGNWLKAVDLQLQQVDALYSLLQRTPRSCQAAALHNLLQAQSPHSTWHAAFLLRTEQQLTLQRSIAPLTLEDPQWNADVLTALAAIAQLQSPISERTLSVRLFADSKRLAVLRSAIVLVLRTCDPQAEQFADDERALLQAYMVQRIPEYVPLAGPLVLQCATDADQSMLLDLRGLGQGLALPTAMLQTCQVHTCTAQAVVTVENATSFHELLVIRPPDVLVLYSGGFASPSTLALLRTLCAAVPGLVLYHWGDLDPAGLRILAHLRSHLGNVQPLGMDCATFQQHHQQAQPLTRNDQVVLKSLYQQPLLADCQPLIERLLTTNSKLEQEAVAPPIDPNVW